MLCYIFVDFYLYEFIYLFVVLNNIIFLVIFVILKVVEKNIIWVIDMMNVFKMLFVVYISINDN